MSLRKYFGDLGRAIELDSAIIADRLILFGMDRVDDGPAAFLEPFKEPLAAVIAIALVLLVKIRALALPAVRVDWFLRSKAPVKGEILTVSRSPKLVILSFKTNRAGLLARWVLKGEVVIPLRLHVLPVGAFQMEIDGSQPSGRCDDSDPNVLLINMPCVYEGDRQEVSVLLRRPGQVLTQPATVHLAVDAGASKRMKRMVSLTTSVQAVQ